MTHNTLRKLLNKNTVVADADGLYTTKQITDAVFGGLHEEKLLTQRQLTRRYELENAITEASVLDRKALTVGFAALADAMTSRIMTSELSRETKEDLLRDLATIPIVCENVARSQSRLRRSKVSVLAGYARRTVKSPKMARAKAEVASRSAFIFLKSGEPATGDFGSGSGKSLDAH
jgi:hypothetical protein